MTSRSDQQAVIIGAGPGLGRSLARRFAREGMPVGLVARDPERLATLAGEIRAEGAAVHTALADVTVPETLKRAVESLRADDTIGVLIYNAALGGGRLSQTPLADLRAASDANLHSALIAVRAALPDLEQVHGTVIFTGGGLALHPNPEQGVLSVGKAQLRAAALTLAEELEPRGIAVRTVTIAGFMTAGTAFAPDLVADTFWSLYAEPGEHAEHIYTGR